MDPFEIRNAAHDTAHKVRDALDQVILQGEHVDTAELATLIGALASCLVAADRWADKALWLADNHAYPTVFTTYSFHLCRSHDDLAESIVLMNLQDHSEAMALGTKMWLAMAYEDKFRDALDRGVTVATVLLDDAGIMCDPVAEVVGELGFVVTLHGQS